MTRVLPVLLALLAAACTDYSKIDLVEVRKPGDMAMTCEQIRAEVDANDAEIDRMAPLVARDAASPRLVMDEQSMELQANWVRLHSRNKRLIGIAARTKRCEPAAYWQSRLVEGSDLPGSEHAL